jgi:hypothetical protein
MVQERDLVEGVAERWAPESFNRTELRLVFERLLENPEQPLDELTESLPPEVVVELDAVLQVPDPNPRLTAETWVTRLQAMAIDEEIGRLQEQHRSAADDAEKDALMTRIRVLGQESATLRPVRGRVGSRPPT